MTAHKGFRYILSAKDRRVLCVHKDTRDAIVAYAKSRNITVAEATQNLLIEAINNEYSRSE